MNDEIYLCLQSNGAKMEIYFDKRDLRLMLFN